MYQLHHKQKHRTLNSYCYGVSMPLDVIKKIDSIRKDIPRSRFILRLIEKNLKVEELQSGQQVGAHAQTVAAKGVPT
jgi:hypothetical protein